ncbi:MAG TPA: AAA family ATPase, partial [Blastocatellia bacterium]
MSGGLLLDSLRVSGFRGFSALEIERLGRINLIAGRNNVGKTAFLEAICLYADGVSTGAVWEILELRDESARPHPIGAFSTGPTGPTGATGREQDLWASVRHLFYGHPSDEKGRNTSAIGIGPLSEPDRTLSIRPVSGTLGPSLRLDLGRRDSALLLLRSLESQRGQKPWVFMPANGLLLTEITRLWDSVALTSVEDDVLDALRIIENDIERVNLLTDPGRQNEMERVPKVKLRGVEEPVLLRSLGDGMNRLFGIALALASSKSGVLLIDEIENGLHYSVQPDVWRLLFRSAARLGVQVFATTHSWDCISAFQSAA